MPCEYVPVAERADALSQGNALLRRALDLWRSAYEAGTPEALAVAYGITNPSKEAINEG